MKVCFFQVQLIRALCVAVTFLPLVTGKEIKVGILLPMTGRWPIGTRIAAAAPLSIQDINNDITLLPAFNLTYSIHDSACVAEKGLRGMVAFEGLDFIIGPGCSLTAQPVATLAKIWNKPIITYAASSAAFIDKTVFSTFATVTAYGRRNQQYTPAFVARLMSAFNWTVCGILTSTEVEWKAMAQKIRALISPLVNVTVYEEHDPQTTRFDEILRRGRENARVFLLLCYVNQVTDIMRAAKNLGMTNGDHAFVTIDLNTDVFYSNGRWTGNDGPGSQFSQDLNGIVDLSVDRPLLSEDFKARYRAMGSALVPEVRQYLNAKPSWYAAFLYDAIWLAALALNDTIADGYDVTNTSATVQRMFNRQFQGESGKVRMINGTRVPLFAVGNIVNGSYKLIMNDSLSQKTVDGLNGIEWPGQGRTVPLSVPPCGFDGSFCINKTPDGKSSDEIQLIIFAVLGACICLVLLVGVAVFLRRRQDQECTYMQWVIPYKAIAPSQEHEPEEINRSRVSQLDDTSLFSRKSTAQGRFRIGVYKGKKVFIKRSSNDAINVTCQCKNDIRVACELRHVNVNPCVGVCVEPLTVCIVNEFCAKGSLQDILLDDNLKLDWTFKMSFAMDIARGMEEIHKSAIGPHGRLKSKNVVVDSYWICKIADYGLGSIRQSQNDLGQDGKAYSELLWTAPELLRESHGRVSSSSADCYAYGIILQEIALREAPFSTLLLSPKEVVYHVRKGMTPYCRPQVPPDSAPSAYRELMAICWDEVPERRPTFSGVLKILKKMNNGKVSNIVDNMVSMMEKYTTDLESLVKERTRQLETEKSKTDELLYRMLPRLIADQLKAGLPLKAESFSEVTVFYCDIVDFTVITALSEPMQVIKLLNDVYSLFDTIMGRYDIYKVETVGDSCLVVSGLPERNGNRHASEIAAMSLHLLNYVTDFRIEHLPDTRLEFRMGIHTGPCVAGIVGLKKPRYDIFGETVNIVKHLESAGIPQSIHVSSPTCRLLTTLGGFMLETRGEMLIKGIGITTTYFLREQDKD